MIRKGLRFECVGDGLCCTDIHVLGPVTRSEIIDVRKLRKDAIHRDPTLDVDALRIEDGGCVFLGKKGCEIHAATGPFSKPAGCYRFPLRVVATTRGGRVGTSHRCPCRTFTTGKELLVEDVEPWVRDPSGRVVADYRAPTTVRLTRTKRVRFARYEEVEGEILEKLANGDPPEVALGAKAFPRLKKMSWVDIATDFRNKVDESSSSEALAWFGDALHAAVTKKTPSERPRPWLPAFARAEKRTPKQIDPEQMLSEFVADEIWCLNWASRADFARTRADLVTRAQLARSLSERFRRAGARADTAMAEAIMMVELAGETSTWETACRAMS